VGQAVHKHIRKFSEKLQLYKVTRLRLASNRSTPNAQHRQPFALSTASNTAKMGRVRTKTVKKSAKVIIERYYPKLTLDFETNKRVCDEIAIIASKRLRNKIGKHSQSRSVADMRQQ
jgi:ribosomal protein S17E